MEKMWRLAASIRIFVKVLKISSFYIFFIINIISQSLRDEYMKTKPKDVSEKVYNKFMIVIDFISEITDSYAKNLYQELYGIY